MADGGIDAAVHFGVVGLGAMGRNLARNVASRGLPVAVYNRTPAKTDQFMADYGHEGTFIGAPTVERFVHSIRSPRSILVMVKAGAGVDETIAALRPLLDAGDLLIDGGNSLFSDTERRLAELRQSGLRYLGMGISGGEEGALRGPSLMPGGPEDAYTQVEPLLTTIAAQVGGEPCCTYIGSGGAGHYVKMVHNGIEYADMQLIAEAYDLLKHGAGMTNDELAATFAEWNSGELESFLIEITVTVLTARDDDGAYLVDRVVDRAAQKGTGRQTSESALELGVPLPSITEAVFARTLSAHRDERVAASAVLSGPSSDRVSLEKAGFVAAVGDALYASKVIAYAQGFALLDAASRQFAWGLRLGDIARIWRGGCIIRARFLDRIREAYEREPPPNLLMAPYFADAVRSRQPGWRMIISEAAQAGIGVPAFSSALAYYDGYRRAQSPANLIQAQRDLFGAHTFERIDKPGIFHEDWRGRAEAKVTTNSPP